MLYESKPFQHKWQTGLWGPFTVNKIISMYPHMVRAYVGLMSAKPNGGMASLYTSVKPLVIVYLNFRLQYCNNVYLNACSYRAGMIQVIRVDRSYVTHIRAGRVGMGEIRIHGVYMAQMRADGACVT